MPSYQAELESEAKPSAIKSINPSLKADVPEARATSQKPVPNATAGVKDDKSSRSEFSVFFRLSSIQRKRKFNQFLHTYTYTRVLLFLLITSRLSQRKFSSVFSRSLQSKYYYPSFSSAIRLPSFYKSKNANHFSRSIRKANVKAAVYFLHS